MSLLPILHAMNAFFGSLGTLSLKCDPERGCHFVSLFLREFKFSHRAVMWHPVCHKNRTCISSFHKNNRHVCNGETESAWLYKKLSFISLSNLLNRLPAMHITVRFNAYLICKPPHYFLSLVEKAHWDGRQFKFEWYFPNNVMIKMRGKWHFEWHGPAEVRMALSLVRGPGLNKVSLLVLCPFGILARWIPLSKVEIFLLSNHG